MCFIYFYFPGPNLLIYVSFQINTAAIQVACCSETCHCTLLSFCSLVQRLSSSSWRDGWGWRLFTSKGCSVVPLTSSLLMYDSELPQHYLRKTNIVHCCAFIQSFFYFPSYLLYSIKHTTISGNNFNEMIVFTYFFHASVFWSQLVWSMQCK